MRTTLTIDEDIAVKIERLRTERKASLKAVVNELLRRGLDDLHRPPPVRAPYRTPSVSLGRCYLGRPDNVADALAIAEGEGFH